MKKTNIGIIGLGGIGKTHLMNCLKIENIQLTAVADISKSSLNRAKNLGVQNIYQDYNELLKNPDVEAVIIALPNHLHAVSAQAAAEKGKHILLEKPIARNTVEGKTILAAAQSHNVKLMIGHPDRFVAENQALKERIEKGELGEIQIAQATNIGSGPFTHRIGVDAPIPVPDWWWNKQLTGGGALIDLGSHKINLLRWFFGDVVSVKGYFGYRYNLDLEDHAVCVLKFAQGTVGVVNVGWFSQQSMDKLDVYGTIGYASAGRKLQGKVKTGLQLMLRQTTSYMRSHLTELEYFVDCIQKDQQPQNTSGQEALKDLEVIEHAYANQEKLV
jgi:UDP-N-acetylglucosamine 3-dehydrogenase